MSSEKPTINQISQLIDTFPDTQVCPVRDIIRANEMGMIVESNCPFEVGASISFGFHVSANQLRHESEFIQVEALVVDSQKLLLTTDRDSYRVTVLYSGVSHRDRTRLIKYTRTTHFSNQSSIGLN